MLDPATRGPAFFALPQDVQAEAYDFPERFFEPTVHYIRRPGPDPRDVEAAAAADRARERPLIIAGGGVHYSGAVDTLRSFAERHAIPVVETVAGQVDAHARPSELRRPDRGHGFARGQRRRRGGRRRHRRRDAPAGLHDRLVVGVRGSRTSGSSRSTRPSWDAHKQGAQPVIGDAKVSLEAIDAVAGHVRGTAGVAGDRPTSRSRSGTPISIHGPGRRHDGPPAYAEVIQAINAVADPEDYILSAAGGLPGELSMGWRSKSVGSFDSEYGYSTMGYEIAGGVGRADRPARRATSSRGSATART